MAHEEAGKLLVARASQPRVLAFDAEPRKRPPLYLGVLLVALLVGAVQLVWANRFEADPVAGPALRKARAGMLDHLGRSTALPE